MTAQPAPVTPPPECSPLPWTVTKRARGMSRAGYDLCLVAADGRDVAIVMQHGRLSPITHANTEKILSAVNAPARSQTGEGETLETIVTPSGGLLTNVLVLDEKLSAESVRRLAKVYERIVELEAEVARLKASNDALDDKYTDLLVKHEDLCCEPPKAQLRAPTPAPSCPTEQGEDIERLRAVDKQFWELAEKLSMAAFGDTKNMPFTSADVLIARAEKALTRQPRRHAGKGKKA